MNYYVIPQCYKDFNTNEFLKSDNPLKIKLAILDNTIEDVIVKLSDGEYQEVLEILDVPSLTKINSDYVNNLRQYVISKYESITDSDVNDIANEICNFIRDAWRSETIVNVLTDMLSNLRTHETNLVQYLVSETNYEILSFYANIRFESSYDFGWSDDTWLYIQHLA